MVKRSQGPGERYTPQLGNGVFWVIAEGLYRGLESVDGVCITSKVTFGAEFNMFPDRANPSFVGRCRFGMSYDGRSEYLALLSLNAMQRYLVGAEDELAGREKPFLVTKQRSASRPLYRNNDAHRRLAR